MGRTTTYAYNIDDRIAKKDYSDTATPDVTYAYDPWYPRLTPWGKVTETGSILSDFTYTGHHYDRPTELNLAWYRGYDPTLARWLSKDPIGLKGGLNLYGYVGNDPVNQKDPKGMSPQETGNLAKCTARMAACRYSVCASVTNPYAAAACAVCILLAAATDCRGPFPGPPPPPPPEPPCPPGYRRGGGVNLPACKTAAPYPNRTCVKNP